MQLKQIDLITDIGVKIRLSEILNRKQKLTVEMIGNLQPSLQIKDYQLMR